jgi:hypothetical protein
MFRTVWARITCRRGLKSRLYDRGRYSPRLEVGTHHFHQLLARETRLG